jgi:RND superfamily putative drug exporter
MVLVPATMELLGRTNWWFPRWLGWLPEVHVEGREVLIDPAVSGSSSVELDELATASQR